MNIIAFSDMRKRFRITVDTSEENAIAVYIGESCVMKILEVGAGLYIWKPEHNLILLTNTFPPILFSVSYPIIKATTLGKS